MNENLALLLQHPEWKENVDWQRRRYAANDFVFREGDQADKVYLVLDGTVRILADLELEEGRCIHPGVCDLGEGEVFGEFALFDRGERSTSVMTVTDCEVAELSGERLLDFLDAHPETGYAVLKELIVTLVSRLRSTNKKLFSILAWGLKARGLDQHL